MTLRGGTQDFYGVNNPLFLSACTMALVKKIRVGLGVSLASSRHGRCAGLLAGTETGTETVVVAGYSPTTGSAITAVEIITSCLKLPGFPTLVCTGEILLSWMPSHRDPCSCTPTFQPTLVPTGFPTAPPVTASPTATPVTASPTVHPTVGPIEIRSSGTIGAAALLTPGEVEKEEDGSSTWWVAVLVGVLLCCLTACCLLNVLLRRREKRQRVLLSGLPEEKSLDTLVPLTNFPSPQPPTLPTACRGHSVLIEMGQQGAIGGDVLVTAVPPAPPGSLDDMRTPTTPCSPPNRAELQSSKGPRDPADDTVRSPRKCRPMTSTADRLPQLSAGRSPKPSAERLPRSRPSDLPPPPKQSPYLPKEGDEQDPNQQQIDTLTFGDDARSGALGLVNSPCAGRGAQKMRRDRAKTAAFARLPASPGSRRYFSDIISELPDQHGGAAAGRAAPVQTPRPRSGTVARSPISPHSGRPSCFSPPSRLRSRSGVADALTTVPQRRPAAGRRTGGDTAAVTPDGDGDGEMLM